MLGVSHRHSVDVSHLTNVDLMLPVLVIKLRIGWTCTTHGRREIHTKSGVSRSEVTAYES